MSNRLTRFVGDFVKYFGVALIGFVVDFGLLTLTTSVFGWFYLIGSTVGFIGGLVVTYLLSERYVFSNPRITSPTTRFLVFAVIGLIGLIILNVLMWWLTSILGIFYVLSKVLATVVVYTWNFLARRALYGSRLPPETVDS